MFAKPFNLSLEEFLRGEGNVEHNLDIIPDYDESWHDFIINRAQNYEWDKCHPKTDDRDIPLTLNFRPIDKRRIAPPSGFKGLCYYKTPNGAIIGGPEQKIIGFYVDSVLAISRSYLGYGLGAEIIVVASLLHGANPACALGPPSYTLRGLASHELAWQMYRRFPQRFVLGYLP